MECASAAQPPTMASHRGKRVGVDRSSKTRRVILMLAASTSLPSSSTASYKLLIGDQSVHFPFDVIFDEGEAFFHPITILGDDFIFTSR